MEVQVSKMIVSTGGAPGVCLAAQGRPVAKELLPCQRIGAEEAAGTAVEAAVDGEFVDERVDRREVIHRASSFCHRG